MSDFAATAGRLLDAMRAQRPLVQNITNFVSMDVAANALLAIGASPAMVHAPEETPEFVALFRRAGRQHRHAVGPMGRGDACRGGERARARQTLGARSCGRRARRPSAITRSSISFR
jgi:hypothetical protein